MSSTLTRQQNDTEIIEIIDLHQQELQLIKALRYNWRHGEITILVKDGLPFRIKRVWENLDLTVPQ